MTTPLSQTGFAFADWMGLAIHILFAVIYLSLFGLSMLIDPYLEDDEPLQMRPLAKSSVILCSLTASVVGFFYVGLLVALIIFFKNDPMADLRYVRLDVIGSVLTIVMLFASAFALIKRWKHSVGLFILATCSSVADAIVLPNTVPKELFNSSQLLTFLGSIFLVLGVGWLYSVQYFYYQKTHE